MHETSEPRLAELVASLSLATDLGMGQPLEQSMRACLLSVRIGEALGWSEDVLTQAYYLSLLRFLGCTADSATSAALYGDEIAFGEEVARLDFGRPSEVLGFMIQHVGRRRGVVRRTRALSAALRTIPKAIDASKAHCEVAQRLAARLGFRDKIQQALGQVFERWDGRGVHRLRGEAIMPSVRVVQIAYDAVTFFRVGGVDAAVTVARHRAGKVYDPAISAAFCRLAGQLFDGLDTSSTWETLLDTEPGPRPRLSQAQLDTATEAIAAFADLKSTYTVGHSSGVAELAVRAANRCRMSSADVTALRRAALVHDVGRVGVSILIWDKPGPLTHGEWERVRLHPYLTERIFARSAPLSDIGSLAALHHERLDGSGYHRSLGAPSLSHAARLLAAADVYHALCEPRAHRPARTPEEAARELRAQVRSGKLDGDVVAAVLDAAGHPVRPSRHEWPAGLSEREVEVLRLLVRGLSNRQVADILCISPKTVGHHVQHIYDKIGVSTRAAAAVFAMENGLIEVSINRK